jgi:diguanylate cyclase (GGDEF)-like protein/PAS domain S-box-containing protein
MEREPVMLFGRRGSEPPSRAIGGAPERAGTAARRLAALVRDTDDAIYAKSLGGIIIDWNPAAERIYGWKSHEIVGRSASLLIPPGSSEDLSGTLGRIRAGERIEPFETVRVRRDGTVMETSVTVSPIRDGAGKVVGASAITRDITARKAAERALQHSEALFAALVESAPDAMVIVGSDGRLLLVNRQTELLFGYAREELLDQPVEILLPGAAAARHRDHRAAYFGEPRPRPMGSGMELFARRADGTAFPVEVSLGPLHTDEGTVVSAAIRDITSRKEAAAALAHAALHDALTALPNRQLLTDRLEQALWRSTRTDQPVAVLFLDLDRFKLINDSHGHAAGDKVLVTVVERIRATVRAGDTVARFGGDEFVVLCEGPDTAGQVADLAERVNASLSAPFAVQGSEFFLSASIGIALGTGGAATADGLLRDADAAMYRAKEQGRAGVEFFDEPMRSQVAGRLEMQNALHRAVERGELWLAYQPIIDLRSSGIVGVEALLRWQHPERGLLQPDAFISLAEDAGLIVPIGRWLIEEAAQACARWRHHDVSVSVNVSARQLRQPDLLETVAAALERHAVPAGALRLELTETVLMEDLEFHGRTLAALRDLGVSLAIDDFGTGYSSLTYLRRFPVSTVKIDRSFVAGLGANLADSAIVDSVINLAHALDLEVVAEGTETAEQVACLLDLGCDKAQGYIFAVPAPAEEIDALLNAGIRAPVPSSTSRSWP